MLTIKRVPTVVSNYQEEEIITSGKPEAAGCGRNCLRKCCLPVWKLPVYVYKKEKGEKVETTTTTIFNSGEEQARGMTFLHNLLMSQWEDRLKRGLFRYDVTTCETKIIPGHYGFVAQLNQGRHLKKRPTEFRIDRVLQPFDDTKFNFTRIGQEEVLFGFEEGEDNNTHFSDDVSSSPDSNSFNVIAINVSPIEYGHVLLIPRVLHCIPQRIDPQSFLLALYMAKEADDSFFRLGYNSLGAFATINNLHFQAYYLAVSLPAENASTRRINKVALVHDRENVVVSELLNYPVRGFVFHGGKSMKDLSDTIANCCIFLQNNNIPFNVLISDSGERIFLFPQCYAEKQALGEVDQELLDTTVNPAVWEIGGHIVLKRKEDYENASEDYACRLLGEVSLSEDRFRHVKVCVLEAAGLKELQACDEDENGDTFEKEDDSLCKQHASGASQTDHHRRHQHLPQEHVMVLH